MTLWEPFSTPKHHNTDEEKGTNVKGNIQKDRKQEKWSITNIWNEIKRGKNSLKINNINNSKNNNFKISTI